MLGWMSLVALILPCPIKKLRPHIFSPHITGMEEVKNTASLTYSIVQKATDEEGLQRLGKVWYRVIL